MGGGTDVPVQGKSRNAEVDRPRNSSEQSETLKVEETAEPRRKGDIGSTENEVKEKPADAGSFNAHRDELLSDAEESYGAKYTEDFNETGFIFPDGKLPKMGDYGQRADDHSIVMSLYDDISYAT